MFRKLHLTKISFLLICVTLLLLSGTIFFALKIGENKTTPTITTKAVSQTYKKVIELPKTSSMPTAGNTENQSSSASESSLLAQSQENDPVLITQTFTPSPTLPNQNLTPTPSPTFELKNTSPTLSSLKLPESGSFDITLVLFFAAVSFVFIGFLL